MVSVRDTVCGMEFPEDDAEILGAERVEHEGTNYWFCCPTCRETFEKNPERYAPSA